MRRLAGNTLFAVDRWVRLGLKDMLRQAMLRGAVLTGGSAGAICWFEGGHSDSMDPDTYKSKMLAAATDAGGDESSTAPAAGAAAKPWEYIRVDGLGFLPGLVCPHHDKTQSNGVLRASDFDQMLLRHSSELGIGIDHWAGSIECKGRCAGPQLPHLAPHTRRNFHTYRPTQHLVPHAFSTLRRGRAPVVTGSGSLLLTLARLLSAAGMRGALPGLVRRGQARFSAAGPHLLARPERAPWHLAQKGGGD